MNRHDRDGGSLDELGDSELVDMTRAGSSRAYGVLWARHSKAAYSVAYAFTSLDADDVVAEAFARVLASIRNGKGPTSGFRPYVAAVVRNVARKWSTVVTSGPIEADFESMVNPSAPTSEDVVIRELDQTAVAAAFRSLPTRWQEALWYSEVDGLKPREYGTLLGMKANAASALVHRAKQGFRDAWVSAQLARSSSPECADVLVNIGPFTRNALPDSKRLRLEKHLLTCPTCPAALKEARSTASNLALVLLPLAAGVAGAASYTAGLKSASTEASPSDDGTLEDKSEGHALGVLGRVILVSLLLVLLIAGTVITVIRLSSSVDEAGPSVSDPTATTTVTATPTANDPSKQEQEPTTEPPTPAPEPTSTPSRPQTPSGTGGGGAGSSPNVSIPGPPVSNDGSATPGMLTVTFNQDPSRRYFPVLTGQDAEPGATVEAVSETGAVLSEAVADRRGHWKLTADSLTAGTHAVAARQKVGTSTSPMSDSIPFDVIAGPQITSPASGSVVSGTFLPFAFTGEPNVQVQRQFVGYTVLQTIRIPASGRWTEYFNADPRKYSMTVRYADTESGQYGPSSVVKFTVE